jgi:hypothetical protein
LVENLKSFMPSGIRLSWKEKKTKNLQKEVRGITEKRPVYL